MCRAIVYMFLTVGLLIATGTHAQKTKQKKEVQRSGLTSVYIKKKLVYRFSPSEYQRFRDSINSKTKDGLRRISDHKIEWMPTASSPASDEPPAPPLQHNPALVNIYKNERLVVSMPEFAYRKFRDSIATTTKDTIYAISDQRVDIHPYAGLVSKIAAIKARPFVWVNPKGYIALSIPDADEHNYRISFFADATEIFQIKRVTEKELVLDKTNFIHAGWFSYELYEEDKLKERGRLFLPK